MIEYRVVTSQQEGPLFIVASSPGGAVGILLEDPRLHCRQVPAKIRVQGRTAYSVTFFEWIPPSVGKLVNVSSKWPV